MSSPDYHRNPLPPVPSILGGAAPPADAPTQEQQTSPAQQPRLPQARKTPRSAVLSLLCGLMAFFTILIFVGVFFALIAVIAGHVALNRIRHSSGRLAGDGLAMTGIVMGYLALVATSGLMLLVLFFYQPTGHYLTQYQQQQSMRHASRLYFAAESYARDHRGAYPKQWDDLQGRYINALDLEDCLNSVYSFKKSPQAAFKLVSHQRPVLPAASTQVVVIQEIAPPQIDSITVVYADGNTELIANPNR